LRHTRSSIIIHPKLGRLEPTGGSDDSFEGVIDLCGDKIDLIIELDTAIKDTVFEFAVSVINSISSLNHQAKHLISSNLLDTYNLDWNEYDEVNEDGSTHTVSNPQLSSDQFIIQFELDGVIICGIDCIELWYKPNALFLGHSIFVTSFDGLNFSETRVQMFG